MDDWRNRIERDNLEHHEQVNSLAVFAELRKIVVADFKSTHEWLLDRQGGAVQEVPNLGCGTGALTDRLSRQSNVSGIGIDSPLSQIRAATEIRIHQALYIVCGRRFETAYTRNICAVGFQGPET